MSCLVVTEKRGNRINTYTINDDGLPSPPTDNASNGMTPFGFAFNNADTLVVSEANQSAASSYSASEDGALSVISGSVGNSQLGVCWLVIPNNGKTAYVSNTGSGTISSYRINPKRRIANPPECNRGGYSHIGAPSNNSRILFCQFSAAPNQWLLFADGRTAI